MTTEHELPPLPTPPSLIQRKDWYGAIQAYARNYGMECARAAVEADRQRRGEPVAQQQSAEAYAGCTIWRGSLRVSVTETKVIEHRIDADDAFFDLVQRALDSLADAWEAAAIATQQQGGRSDG